MPDEIKRKVIKVEIKRTGSFDRSPTWVEIWEPPFQRKVKMSDAKDVTAYGKELVDRYNAEERVRYGDGAVLREFISAEVFEQVFNAGYDDGDEVEF